MPGQGSDPMEADVSVPIQEEDPSPRRILVDVNNPNVEIQDAKKPQVPQETEKKKKVIRFIAKSHKAILNALGLAANEKHINLGDQVHNILFTAYNVLRQHHNATGGTLVTRIQGTEFKVTFENRDYPVNRDAVCALITKIANDEGIPFGKYQNRDPANWYEIAGPLLNFLGGFALRKKELIERRGNVEKAVTLAQYGIYGLHHPLCEGVTFAPEKRSSMAQTVGPLTALLCYLKSDRRFSEKWAIACKRAMAHFPDIDTVLAVVREKDPTEIRPLITLLADIALIVTTRQANRMFPLPAVFSFIFTKDSHRVGGSTYNTELLLNEFNFSGHGAFAFYKIFQSTAWKLSLNGGNDGLAKQVVYHSMFGTYKEDLSILEKITNYANWATREEMGRIFQKSNTEGASITFTPVQQIYYSKMAQANQTGLLTTSYSQLSSQPVFSGISKRKFADAFFDHLTNGTQKTSGGKSLQALISSYAALKESLREMLEKKGRILEMGTTGWRRISDITPTLEGGEDADIEITGHGKFFLGRSD